MLSRAGDIELARRVKMLRSQLGLLQADFAAQLHVSRTQVGEWERGGDERPSTDKLLEMAVLAPTRADRLWFWKRAGVNLEAIKADFREELQVNTSTPESGQILRIPVQRDIGYSNAGTMSGVSDRDIELLAKSVQHPASTVCLQTTKQTPWAPSADDLVLVDQTVTNVWDLQGQLAAVYFDPFPVYREISDIQAHSRYWHQSLEGTPPLFVSAQGSKIFRDYLLDISLEDTGEARNDLETKLKKRSDEILRAGFIIGTLHLHRAVLPSSQDELFKESPWCWSLITPASYPPYQLQIALSPWKVDCEPTKETHQLHNAVLFDGVRIVGKVVDWMVGKAPV